ncbi:hypothetical protein F896_00674 [Acinetobacter genomosp. 15BJ]|uniref:Uncharacterized protein n=1 Tax=Acinetobacter genomosp. 15BJ TaxID=106651 RepID=R9B5E5_9GAMM|nr:hypothetical protein F896_00674 [Acinetobacter genomosp. 15BJ]
MTTIRKNVISRPNRQQVNTTEAMVKIRIAHSIAVQNTAELVAKRQEGQC